MAWLFIKKIDLQKIVPKKPSEQREIFYPTIYSHILKLIISNLKTEKTGDRREINKRKYQ